MRHVPPQRRANGVFFLVEELEPRLLFSADAATLLGLPVTLDSRTEAGTSLSAAADATMASVQVMQAVVTAPSTASAATVRHELVFVDATVPEADKLIQGIQAGASADKVIDVVMIEAGEDGLARITGALQQRQDLDAVHIISHGDAGGLQLGTTRLDAASLNARLGDISSWGRALTPDADLMLYGCDLTSSAEGQALADNLALLTGADVAASKDLTGAASLGGNWALEYTHGHIDASVIVGASLAHSWNHVLATLTLQEGTNGYTGTTDTYLHTSTGIADNTSYATSTTLLAGEDGTGGQAQLLLRFDNLVGAGVNQIPTGSVITGVTLTLQITTQSTFTNPAFAFHRMTAAWQDTSTWGSMGDGIGFGEYNLTTDGTITEGGTGSYTISSNANMIAAVQGWINNPSSNYGWFTDNGDYSSRIAFASSENATAANRPKLVITYTPPTPQNIDLDANNSSGGTVNNYSGAFTEQTPVKIADTDATISGGSTTSLTGMAVTLTNPLDGVLESLSATNTGNITSSYNSGTGVLTLSGTDTIANYQTVLRSITYSNTSDNPATTSRTINVVGTDTNGVATATATTTLTVTRVNDAPVITSNSGGASASVSVKETLTAVTTVAATDVDSASLTYSISGGADAGKFAINATTGVLTFSAAPDYEAPTDVGANNVYDVIVQVSDGTLADTQAIAVTVTDVVSTLTVTTIADNNDSGLGTSFTAEQLNALSGGTDTRVSLREAIIAANTTAGTDTINFAITGATGTYGEYTITLGATLPTITGAVYINAASQTGYTNRPVVVLDGNGGAGEGFNLSNSADGSTIRGFVIRGFSANGIYVQTGSDNNTIVGNYIGSFNADGSNAGASKRNASEGIEAYGANLTIGGTTAADRNVISGNTSAYNIYLATGADGAVIKGNYFGLNAAGTSVFSSTNSAYGIMIENAATNVTIGGTAAGAGNVISGFTNRGVWVSTTGTVTVQGNYIGTDATGTVDLGNAGYGLYVDDGGSATIGGTTAGAGNLVSGNDGGGIYVGSTGGATIQGNTVGLNAAGMAALGNTGVGIYLNTGNASTVGGNTASARNLVSGNSTYGIQVVSSPTGGHVVKGNYIGVGADGTTLLGNGSAGVYITGSGTTIGGKGAGDGNTIAGNGGAGIVVAGGNGSMFYRNAIHSNTGLGIDLNDDGVTANDYNDGDGGPNYQNNFPVITSAVTNGSSTTITGSIEWYNQAQPIYIEFFSSPSKDASGYGEGRTYLGYVQVTTDATTGDASFSLTVSGVSVGDWITAVANVEGGPLGASEFAMAVQAVAPANAPRGKLIWNNNDRFYQSFADWGSSGWSGVGTTGLGLTDDISMITAAEAPTRNEIIFIGAADVSGKILAAIWNGSTWSSVLSLPVASPSAAASKYDSFAIAYDSVSGDAMLIWDNGNSGTTGLSYATWNGSTWSSIGTITAPVSGEPEHMKLVANPLTHEMVLAVSTTAASNNQYAVVWNGSSWGNAQTLGSNSSQQWFEMNVAYEQASGRAMVVYDASASNSASVQYRIWNGTSWSVESTVTAPGGVTAGSELYSTVVASDARSNRIALAAQDAAGEIWLGVWDGSSWGSTQLATASGADLTEHHSSVSVAFESQSGDLLAAYGKTTGPNVFYRTWASGGGWSGELTGPSMGGSDTPLVVKLYADPYSNTIMLGVQDDAQDLNMAAWDGSAWGTVTELDANTGFTYRENFTYVWYQNAPVIRNLAGDTLAYSEDQAASVIDQNAAASVSAGYGYSGGNLTVSFVAGSTSAEDVLGVRNQGVGAGQIGVSGGNITYGGTLIGTYTGGTGGASLVISLNGSATDAAVGALINNVTYQNTNNATPSTTNRTVRFVATNAIGQASANNDVTVTVTAVNDAPVNTVPAAQTTNEDTAKVFSSANGNLISIADVDAASGSMQVTLSVTNGTLALSGTTGLSFSTGDGTADASMVFTGTVANINAALAGLSYAPTANYNGSAVLTIVTSDQGNTGSGGTLTDTDTVNITVTAVNDAPVNTVPAAQTTNEDTAKVFSSGNGNLISIADVDAASGSMRVTVSALNGALTLSGVSGLSFVTGDGTSDTTMTFTGTVANINAALAGMSYLPTANYNGADTLTIVTSDQGNTGTGGTLTDTDTVNITVTAVNDAPVNTVPAAQTTNEDTAKVFSSANGNLISITDVDAASGSMRITLSVTNGSLTLSGLTGLSFTTGDGTADTSMVFTGTVANVNAALAGLSYTPTANYNGGAVLTIVTSDQGNTGSGGTITDTDTVNITVSAVNDAPTVSIVAPSYSATEQISLNLHGTGLGIADVDAAGGTVQATLSVVSGILTVGAGSTGVVVSGSGTNTVTLTGTMAQINTLLAGGSGGTATYLLGSDTPPASDTLTLAVNDQGNAGSGGAKTGSGNVTVSLAAVNDAPVASITQPSYTATYLTNLLLSGTGIGINDVDAGGAGVQATLSVVLGTLNVSAGSTGVVVGGSGTGTVTLTGTVAQITSLLNGSAGGTVTYINNSGTPLASDTLTVDVSDLGNTGSGGTLTHSANVAIDVLQTAPIGTLIVPGVSRSDIAAFYGFNASGNLARDDSSGGHALTLGGTYSQTADVTALQSALLLAGGSGEIAGLQTGGAMTIASWVRFDSTGTGARLVDFGDANNSGIGNIVLGRAGNSSDLQFLIDTPGNPHVVTATGAIANGAWMHVAATVDATGMMSLYVNGTLVGSTQGVAPATGVRSHNHIGQSNTAGDSLLDGAVDDLLIANKALTAAQIATIYTQSNGFAVPERSANGTVVGTVLDSSAVAGNTVSYSLVNSAGGRFAIDTNTGVITVADGTLLKYENAHSHNITVRATDSGGQALDTVYVVNLSDFNQAPQGADNTISATEDTAYVFTVADFGFTDPGDNPANSLLAVKITSVPGSGGLTLDGTTVNAGDFVLASDILAGKLRFTAALHANGLAYDSLGFQVQDNGGVANSGVDLDPVTRTMTIDVAAVNDAPAAVIVPPTYTATEQTTLVLQGTGLGITDVDAGGATVQATLSVTSGVLTVGAGTTGVVVSGSSTGTVILTGTLAEINDLLAGNLGGTVSYLIGSDTPAASDTLVLAVSDLGNAGSGGTLTASDSATINITAVNDSPVNTVPGAQTMDEDGTLVFSSGNGNLISVSDLDAGSGSLQVSISVTNGRLSLSGLTGLTFITGDGTLDASMVFTGTVADVNAALAGLSYLPTGDHNGSDTLTLVTSDLGNTGTGGVLQDASAVGITIDAVNDSPVNSVPGAQVTNEDTALVFSSGNGNLIAVADVDAASGSMQVTIGVLHGALSLSGVAGLSFSVGDGMGDASMTFTGTLASINAALAGLSYAPAAHYNGSDTLTIVTSDLGNTGTGGTLLDTETVAITVNAVNDAPLVTVPSARSIDEDSSLVFSSVNGTLISVSDVDAGGGSLQITIGVLHGSLSLSGTHGLSFTTGDGTADASMVFTGTVADISAALAGMSYTPSGNYSGTDTLSILASDLGNNGAGGVLTHAETVAITVNAVNDVPVNAVPAAQSVNEDAVLVFSSGNGNLVSVSDVDAAGGNLQVAVSVLHGSLSLSGTTGLSFTFGDGALDASMVFTGSAADINAALAGMTYTPAGDYDGADTFTITTSDLGNAGTGGAMMDTNTVAITVNAVNDAPVNTVPAAQSTNEDTALVFSTGNGNAISVADVDAASGSVQVTVSVLHGALTLSGVAGLSFTSGDGTGDTTMTFSGGISAVNAALAGLSYLPTAEYSGADTLTIVTSDLGNAGAGGTLGDTDTVAITVNGLNDAPVNTVPAAQSTNEDTALVFSSGNGNLIAVGDADVAIGNMQVSISVLHGALSLSGLTGLSFVTGDGIGDMAMTFSGSMAAINAALAGLSYAPAGNFHGADTLTITTSDLGNSGPGGVLQDTDTLAITVDAVNDLPVGSVAVTGTAIQGQTLTASSTLTDADGMGTVTYHWLRNGVDTGSTGSSYLLLEADVGATMSAWAVYTDGDGTVESVTSVGTAVVANVNDVPTGGVLITGSPTQGQTLSASHTIADPDGVGAITYHWLRNGVDTGGTGGVYVLSEADVGATMSVRADYTDGHGTAETTTSASTAPVANVNDLPTGSVLVNGTPTQGQTLTASNSLADIDGLGSVTYHWLRDGVDTGSTGGNYVLSESDVGAVITARATYTDGHGTVEAVDSVATAPVGNVNDVPAGVVTISGTAAQGQTLTLSHTLTDSDGLGAITYHWLRNGVDTGSTGGSYVLSEADVGSTMSVRATYTDGHGTPEAATSAPTAAVANVNDLPTGSVLVSGTAAQGQTLSASNSLADIDGLGAITYHWLRNGMDTGSTGGSYALGEADVGATMSVRATYTDGHGTPEAVNSAATGAVANVNDAPTGAVTITGNAVQGQTLSASNNIADADGLGAITYHWLRDGIDTGHTGTTYHLAQADTGGVFSVRASYTDGHGTAEAVLSGDTAPVADINLAPVMSGSDIVVVANPGITLLPSFLLGGASDPDGDVLSVKLISSVSHGELVILSDGSLQYQAAAGFAGSDTLTYVAFDGQADSVVRTVVIVVPGGAVVGGGAAPVQPVTPPAATLPDFESGTGGGTAPIETPEMATPTPPAASEPEDQVPGDVTDITDDRPTEAGPDGRNGKDPYGSGSYRSAPGLYAANQAGGFVFRLEAGGLDLGINAGNVLIEMVKGLQDVKLSDQSLNLTFSPVGVHDGAQVATSLRFTETAEDRVVKVEKMVIQTSGAALSVGAVWWAARMSGLLASLMISTPAWRSIDPLPVMGLSGGPDPDDDGDEGDGSDHGAMDARAARLFGNNRAAGSELEGIG